MTTTPQELREAWAHVFAHAWHDKTNDFLRRLNKDPRATISAIAKSNKPETLGASCATIMKYVNDKNSEEGFLALPSLPENLRSELNEQQLYEYANQDGLYGILRVS